MTKMKMPEMDVIRFEESDVIVASGGVVGKTLSITGLGDGKRGNAIYSIGGNNYSSNDVQNYYEGFETAYNTYMDGLDTFQISYYDTNVLYGNNSEKVSIFYSAYLDVEYNTSADQNGWANTTFRWRDGGWHIQ